MLNLHVAFSVYLSMLTLPGWQEDLCALQLWPNQTRAKRMMWLMDSDLVGLRTLADAGPSLNNCFDLFIHQADCDKASSAARLRRRNFPHPHGFSKAFASPQEGEGRPAELRAVGLLLEIWTLSKLWADLVYGGEADKYLAGQADGRDTRGPGTTFRLSAVALLCLFMRKRHLQHTEFRKMTPAQRSQRKPSLTVSNRNSSHSIKCKVLFSFCVEQEDEGEGVKC